MPGSRGAGPRCASMLRPALGKRKLDSKEHSVSLDYKRPCLKQERKWLRVQSHFPPSLMTMNSLAKAHRAEGENLLPEVVL